MNISIKTLVKDTTADFICYRDGDLWYRVTGEGFAFEFPVPVSDTGNGIFPAQIKAITLMRWIRKHLENADKPSC